MRVKLVLVLAMSAALAACGGGGGGDGISGKLAGKWKAKAGGTLNAEIAFDFGADGHVSASSAMSGTEKSNNGIWGVTQSSGDNFTVVLAALETDEKGRVGFNGAPLVLELAFSGNDSAKGTIRERGDTAPVEMTRQ